MKWEPPKWFDKIRQRRARSRLPGRPTTMVCPRCRRTVNDNERGRTAHRQGCVQIPRNRPKNWGVKTRVH